MSSMESGNRPRWGGLYATVALGLGVLALSEALVAMPPARRLLQIIIVLLMYGLMAVWVRANRAHLVREDWDLHRPDEGEVGLVSSDRRAAERGGHPIGLAREPILGGNGPPAGPHPKGR